ncbi:MAG TPA: TrkA C-terminal domain-containing protein [Wenzhouxiangellaceae bacterium]|nr:TrkA C-terminal domain-containing protein [Wenzhouxiangellaceae bacterium]
MIAVITLLLVLVISFLITRIASAALTHTGLSREVARFQARSALTGAGFTTTESERLVNHPVRRRILMMLMLVGNAGIITAVSSLILAFVDSDDPSSLWLKVALLVAGVAVLWTVATSQFVDRHLSRLIDRLLRRYTSIEVRDFGSLLGLSGDYRVVELVVSASDWLAARTVAESELLEEGVLLLAIQRKDGQFIGTPTSDVCIEPEDSLVLYGHVDALENLDERRYGLQGNLEHEEAKAQKEERAREELESADRESGEDETG